MNDYPRHERNDDTLKAVLILIIIGIISFTAYYVATAHSNASATLASSAATSLAYPQKSVPHTNVSFKVPELGIELVNVPKSLQDLVYVTDLNSPQLVRVDFSTLSLSQLDTHCSPVANVSESDDGVLSRYPGTYNSSHKPVDGVVFIKQLGNYWIGFTAKADTCSSNATTETLHDEQMVEFKSLVSSPADIQPLQ